MPCSSATPYRLRGFNANYVFCVIITCVPNLARYTGRRRWLYTVQPWRGLTFEYCYLPPLAKCALLIHLLLMLLLYSTVSGKKYTLWLLMIPLAILNKFSKFFYWHTATLWKISDKIIVEDLTSPNTRHYTTYASTNRQFQPSRHPPQSTTSAKTFPEKNWLNNALSIIRSLFKESHRTTVYLSHLVSLLTVIVQTIDSATVVLNYFILVRFITVICRSVSTVFWHEYAMWCAR